MATAQQIHHDDPRVSLALWEPPPPRDVTTPPGLCPMCGGRGDRRYGLANTHCTGCYTAHRFVIEEPLGRIERAWGCRSWWDRIAYRSEWRACDRCQGTGRR